MRFPGDEHYIILTGQSQPTAKISSHAASAEHCDPHNILRE
jgi:hypothetical protein